MDSFTLTEKLGTLEGKKVCIFGDIRHSRVALSNVLCLKLLGAEVMVCGPATLIPKHFGSLGVQVGHDVDAALAWCDVANVLRIQLERQGTEVPYFPSLEEYHAGFGITQ